MQTIEGALVPVQRGRYEGEPLRVLHLVCDADAELSAWGKERAIRALMQTQRESGIVEPELVCLKWGQLAGEMLEARFPVTSLEDGGGVPAKAIAKLRRIIGSGSMPVVHTHSHRANLVGRVARLAGARMQRLVATYHGWDEQTQQTGLDSRIDRRFSTFSDLVTVPDATMAHLFPKAVRVVHLADAIAYEPLPTAEQREKARARYGFRPDDFVVGFAGRVNEANGALELLNAARGTQDRAVLWAVAGSGELAGSFQVAGLKNVRLLGALDDVTSFFASLDAFVQASHRDGPSPALLAAMRAGLPSVVTRVGATELAARHDVEALIVEPGDVEDLLQRVVLLRRSPLLRARLGAAARYRFESTFDIRYQHEALLDVYRYGGMKRV